MPEYLELPRELKVLWHPGAVRQGPALASPRARSVFTQPRAAVALGPGGDCRGFLHVTSRGSSRDSTGGVAETTSTRHPTEAQAHKHQKKGDGRPRLPLHERVPRRRGEVGQLLPAQPRQAELQIPRQPVRLRGLQDRRLRGGASQHDAGAARAEGVVTDLVPGHISRARFDFDAHDTVAHTYDVEWIYRERPARGISVGQLPEDDRWADPLVLHPHFADDHAVLVWHGRDDLAADPLLGHRQVQRARHGGGGCRGDRLEARAQGRVPKAQALEAAGGPRRL
eukprot:3346064-Pyramimonas_sp.AAC.1